MLTAEQLGEQWRPVLGNEDRYEVSNLGRVRGLTTALKCRAGGTRVRPQRILRPSMYRCGYWKVSIGRNGKFKTMSVHRLVAKAFCLQQDGKNYVNHRNGCKTDNRPENLEWVTRAEDAQHAQDTGLNNARYKARTISMAMANKVRDIREKTGWGGYRIARSLSIPKHVVDAIIYRGNYVDATAIN